MTTPEPQGPSQPVDDRQSDYFHLRTQWLRYRSQLFDSSIGVPTLAAIFDDIRRTLEDRGSLMLVYIDLSRENRIEEIWGWQTYDEVLREFGLLLEQTRASVLPPDSVLSLMHVRGDEFLLFLAPSDRIARTASVRVEVERLAESFTSTMNANLARLPADHHTRQLQVATGIAFVQLDPMQRIERQIHRAINEARLRFERNVEQEESAMKSTLLKIISERDVRTLFQPIVYLGDRSVLGYEALSRGPASPTFKDTETLFSFADKSDLGPALDRLCRETALRSVRFNGSKHLFLNTSATAVRDPTFIDDAFVELIRDRGMKSQNIVFEITERVKIDEWAGFKKIVERLRKHRFSIAIDDMGAGYSSLQSIAELQPEFLKFDMSLVRNIDQSLIKQDLLKVIVTLSEKLKAPIIAEGVETEEEYTVLRELGVKLGQGHYFGPPFLPEKSIPGEA